MAKNPHPSGRPIRDQYIPKKPSSPTWRCPLEAPATPRLRAKPLGAPADAVGYLRVYPTNDDDGTIGRVGFVIFPR
jgi:hypothetical protein